MNPPPSTTETMTASTHSAHGNEETPVFVSERPLRRLLVRGAIGVLAGLFAAWVIALASGVSGVGSLPGLKEKGGGSDEPVATAAGQAPASLSETSASGQAGTVETGGSDPIGTAAPAPRPKATGGTGTGGSLTPVAPTTHTRGTPDVTPGGNVPGANANGGIGTGSGQGGGRTKTG